MQKFEEVTRHGPNGEHQVARSPTPELYEALRNNRLGEYGKWTVAMLKEELKNRGIPHGKLRYKHEMIERLVDDDVGDNHETGRTADGHGS